MTGQVDFENRALVRLAVDVNKTAILFDDTVDDGQSQAHAAPRCLFGAEERFEQFVRGFRRKAAPVVADNEGNIFARENIGPVDGVVSLTGNIFHLYSYLATTRDRIPGVAAQVDEDLLDLGGMHGDRPQPSLGDPDKVDIGTGTTPQHRH